MGISFARPWILIVAVFALAFIVWTFYKSQRTKTIKEKLVNVIRCIIIVLLILALSGMSIRKYTDKTTVIFAADLSSSTEQARDEMESFINSAIKNKSHKFQAGIVSFGKESVVEQSVSGDMVFNRFETIPSPHFTDIDSALNMSSALMPDNTRKRIVLMTDGNENLGDVLQRARILASQDIRIDGVFFDTMPQNEVQITSLDMPDTLYKGENYDISVNIDSTKAQAGVLRLYANRQLISEQSIEIQKGENRFVFKDTAKEGGIKTYEAKLSIADDSIVKNNSMSSFVNIKGIPSVAVVEGQQGDSREIIKILRASGIDVREFNPKSLPEEMEELRKFHGIILNNVSAEDLGDEKINLIDSYVKNLGRGLLVTGGDNSYALGGYMATGFEKMLPVSMNLNQRADIPSLGLVLVIDKSGSMSGGEYGFSKIELAKEAAIRSTDVLRPVDHVGVVVFDGAASWVVKTQQPKDLDKIKSDIGTIRAGGGTNIYPGLYIAYDSLRNLDTKLKHIILLTDGQSQNGNYSALINDMVNSGITLSTVAVGSSSDTMLLQELAKKGNGRYYYSDEFSSLPKIFTKETYMATQAYVQNRTFYPVITGYSPVISDFQSGFPSLDGYITTMPKDRADILLSSDQNDPIFAEWQYGLGKVAAWTSDVRGIWSSKWMSWGNSERFWMNVISSILPDDKQMEGGIETKRVGSKGIVTVNLAEDVDKTLKSKAVIVSPSGEEMETDLDASEPGKYVGNFDIDEPGVYLIRAVQQKDGEIVNNIDTGMSVAYSPEYDIRQKSSKEFLKRIVAETGGNIIEKPEEVFKDNLKPVWTETEIWFYLIVLALILFVLDIVLRRLKLEAVFEKFIKNKQENKKEDIKEPKRQVKNKKINNKKPKNTKNDNLKEQDFTSELLNARRNSKHGKL